MADKHNHLKEKLEASLKDHTEEPVIEGPVSEELHYDATNEEIAAGKAANTVWEQRAKAEADAGRKLVAQNEARTKKATPKEDTPESK